jgi:Na+-driven multidrug efflux pump
LDCLLGYLPPYGIVTVETFIYIFYIKKTYILAWVTFFCAGVNVILNYFFIKANGAIGAAQATTITFFIQFILTFILSSKVYKMPWNVFSIFKNAC